MLNELYETDEAAARAAATANDSEATAVTENVQPTLPVEPNEFFIKNEPSTSTAAKPPPAPKKTPKRAKKPPKVKVWNRNTPILF